MNDFLEAFNRWPMRKVADGEKSSSGPGKFEPITPLADGGIIFTDGYKTDRSAQEDILAPFLINQGQGIDAIGSVETIVMPSEKIVSVPVEPVIEAVSKAVKPKTEVIPFKRKEKEVFPQKGDVFQDATSGDRIVVEGIDRRDGELGVSYRETYASGKSKGEGKIFWKIPKSFHVMVDTKEMQKNDPLKELHPEFYAIYGEQMTKADNAFTREFEASRTTIESWDAFIDEEYNPVFSGKVEDPAKKREGKKMLKQSRLIHEKIEAIGERWNKLDDHIVEQGRQELALLAEVRALEKQMPEFALELKASELKRLEEEQGSDEPDVELVEKGYQRILLKGKNEALLKKYKQARKNAVVEETLILNAFVDQIKNLLDSVDSEESSSEDIKKVLVELNIIEKQMFGEKRGQSDENGMGENGSVGGLVKGKTSRKQTYKGEIKENEAGNKKYIRPIPEKRVAVDEKSGYSPFVTHGNGVELNGNTNTMPSGEIPKQGDIAVKADDVHNTPTAETVEDILWRAELDNFQEFPEGLKAVEKLKEMLVEEWGIFEQRLLDEARKRDIRIFPDEVAKLWRNFLLKQLREMTIEYLNRYQSVPIKNGKNIFNAIIRTLEESREGTSIESRNRVSGSVQEMNGDLSKEMTDSMLVRVKNHLDLNGKREKPAVAKQEQEKENLSDEKQFALLVEALRSKRKPFGKDKEGKELIIESISSTEIKYRYGADKTVTTPVDVKDLLRILREDYRWEPRVLLERRAASEAKEAEKIMAELGVVISEKKVLFEAENTKVSASPEVLNQNMAYLDRMAKGAQKAFDSGNIKGIRAALKLVKESQFWLNISGPIATRKPEGTIPDVDASKIVSPYGNLSTTAREEPVQIEAEKRYEELESLLDQSEIDELAGITGTGLKELLVYSRDTGKSKKEVVEEAGMNFLVEELLVPAIKQVLPSEWADTDKEDFSRIFGSKRIEIFVSEKPKK